MFIVIISIKIDDLCFSQIIERVKRGGFMNAKEQIDAINRAYADTDFVLKKPKYVSGLNSALSRWVISLAVSNFILFLVEQIAKYFSLIDLETYYQIFRPLYLIINVMPLFFFFSFLLNKDNTLEENHFLKMFSIVR